MSEKRKLLVPFVLVGTFLGIFTLLTLPTSLAASSYMVPCDGWVEFSPEERDQAFQEGIRNLLDSPEADKWTSLNKTRIEKCLLRTQVPIEDDFDDACSKGVQAPMDALDRILLEHAFACIR